MRKYSSLKHLTPEQKVAHRRQQQTKYARKKYDQNKKNNPKFLQEQAEKQRKIRERQLHVHIKLTRPQMPSADVPVGRVADNQRKTLEKCFEQMAGAFSGLKDFGTQIKDHSVKSLEIVAQKQFAITQQQFDSAALEEGEVLEDDGVDNAWGLNVTEDDVECDTESVTSTSSSECSLIFTDHSTQRKEKRGISTRQIQRAVKHGRRLPDSPMHPSTYTMRGEDTDVVLSKDDDKTVVTCWWHPILPRRRAADIATLLKALHPSMNAKEIVFTIAGLDCQCLLAIDALQQLQRIMPTDQELELLRNTPGATKGREAEDYLVSIAEMPQYEEKVALLVAMASFNDVLAEYATGDWNAIYKALEWLQMIWTKLMPNIANHGDFTLDDLLRLDDDFVAEELHFHCQGLHTLRSQLRSLTRPGGIHFASLKADTFKLKNAVGEFMPACKMAKVSFERAKFANPATAEDNDRALRKIDFFHETADKLAESVHAAVAAIEGVQEYWALPGDEDATQELLESVSKLMDKVEGAINYYRGNDSRYW